MTEQLDSSAESSPEILPYNKVDWERVEREGRGERRPWGGFITLWVKNPEGGPKNADFSRIVAEKIFYILPGQRLSYQKHKFRSEHWRVEEGEAEITLGAIDNPKKQTVRALVPGEAIDIECLAYHRAANPSQETVLIIYEWQRGFYDETDIVRIEDDYNRADNLQASP